MNSCDRLLPVTESIFPVKSSGVGHLRDGVTVVIPVCCGGGCGGPVPAGCFPDVFPGPPLGFALAGGGSGLLGVDDDGPAPDVELVTAAGVVTAGADVICTPPAGNAGGSKNPLITFEDAGVSGSCLIGFVGVVAPACSGVGARVPLGSNSPLLPKMIVSAMLSVGLRSPSESVERPFLIFLYWIRLCSTNCFAEGAF